MAPSKYFMLNSVDFGFFDKTDVRTPRAKVHVWLMTAPMALIRDLHHGMADHGWRAIPDFHRVDGLTMCANQRGGGAGIEG